MIESPPNSTILLEHFCPLFIQIAQMGLILPRIPPPTPVLHSADTFPCQGHVHTPNTLNPTPKHPFAWPELESGQNELPSVRPARQMCKMFEKWTKLF